MRPLSWVLWLWSAIAAEIVQTQACRELLVARAVPHANVLALISSFFCDHVTRTNAATSSQWCIGIEYELGMDLCRSLRLLNVPSLWLLTMSWVRVCVCVCVCVCVRVVRSGAVAWHEQGGQGEELQGLVPHDTAFCDLQHARSHDTPSCFMGACT